jgi:acetolactate synthase small subunit
MVRDAKAKTEEHAQLLSGSVSTVYALECGTSRLQKTINTHREEIVQLNRSNEEMKESWNVITTTNSTLRAQLNLVELSFTAEQRDASARLQEDLRLRNELAMCISRESIWKHELQAAKDHTLIEAHAFRSECQNATDELSEVVGHLKTSRSSLEYFEQQTYTWTE